MTRSTFKFFALGALLSLLAYLPAFAQTGQGAITGTVTDPRGDLIPAATVEVMNVDTGVVQRGRSNSSGSYTFSGLNPGNYTVTVTKDGFERQTVQGVTLQAAGTVSVDLKLQVGQQTETVTINADEVLVTKTTSDVSTTVDHKLVEELPYPERSSLQSVLLVPGVTGEAISPGGVQSENASITSESRTTGASISIAGAGPGTASIMVDGSDVTQGSYPRAGVNLSGQLVQETTVITGGLSAKYGRTSGGSVVQSSKAGTNHYHGGITWRHTDPFFQAVPVGGTIGPNRHENFYGFYFGGPVWIPKVYNGHDRTFFYVGVEPARLSYIIGLRGSFLTPDDIAGRLNNSLPLLNQTILKSSGYGAALAAARNSDLYYQGALNAQGFPVGPRYSNSGLYQKVQNNDLSQQLANNPFAKFVLSQMPTPTNPGPYVKFDNAQAAYANDGTNGSYSRGVTNRDNRYSIRVDHQFSNRDSMFVRFTSIPVMGIRFSIVSPDNPLTPVNTDSADAYNTALGWNHVFSPTVVNNAHFSYLRVFQDRGAPPGSTTKDWAASFGLTPATNGYGFPSLGSFSANGVSYSLSPGSTGAGRQIDQNFIAGDDVTWTHSRHLFQFGGDFRWIQSNQYNNGFTTGGGYTFAQSATNNGSTGGLPLATFILGLIPTFQTSPAQVPGYYRWRYGAGYFQDDWRITPNLTLNLGLRYNVETPRMEKYGNQPVAVFNQPNSLNGVATTAAFCFSGGCPGVGKTLWPINWWGLEPRFGIAYAPTARTSIRAAYAMTRLPLTGFYNLPLPDLTGASAIGGQGGGVRPNELVSYMTNPVAPVTSAFQALNGARGPILYSTGINPIAVPQTSAVPYTQTWNLTVQYEPAKQTLVQVTYQGLKGTHLFAPVNGTTSQYGVMNQPSLSTVSSAIRSHANLGRVLATCAATNPAAGCGNPYRIPTSTTNSTPITETALQALNPYQNFFNQTIPLVFDRRGNSIYHGLLINMTHRRGANLSLLASYSWTKVMDDVAETTGANNSQNGLTAPPQNPFDLEHERSLASFDQPSRLRVGFTYTLPFGIQQRFRTNNRIADNLLGNFNVSGMLTSQSGFPNFVLLGSTGYFTSVTPKGQDGCTATNYCTSAAFPAGYQLRPKRIRGVPVINPNWKSGGGGVFSSTFVPYINPDAFTVPGGPDDPQVGDVPRLMGDARSPREFFFDMNVKKSFVIHDNLRFAITGTFNNVFNHVVYFGLNQTSKSLYTAASVSTTTGQFATPTRSAAFGQMTNNSGNLSRVIRVGAELTF